MTSTRPLSAPPISSRIKLLDAAHHVVRRKGYAATTVDEICAAAGVSKGAFFHHFESKEALGVAAAEQWTNRAAPMFEFPPHAKFTDPLDRFLGHIDFRFAMLEGPVADFTCFVGTMLQESFATSDPIRVACDASISAYCERLAVDIQQALDLYGTTHPVTALGLARHTQAVLQGAFIMAKAKNSPDIARDSITHLKQYIEMLFERGERK
jgi:TetR/AcrR family transcriptional regulator, transcriptional repressor for nem operon